MDDDYIGTGRTDGAEKEMNRTGSGENVGEINGGGDLARPRIVDRWREKKAPGNDIGALSTAVTFINRLVLQTRPAHHGVPGGHPAGRLLEAPAPRP